MIETELITEAAVTWLAEPFNTMVATELTNEWSGSNRFDVVALQPNKHLVYIVEVKVSRPDFLRGVRENQLERYQEYCHRLFVAAPRGLIHKDELPENVGLLQVGKTGKARLAKRAGLQELSEARYKLMLERVMQKLIVEGSRWSQEAIWKKKNEEWHRGRLFRDWLCAQEGGTISPSSPLRKMFAGLPQP